MALFVLVVACLGCVQMFHLGLRSSATAEKRAVAAFLANKRLTQVQVWAKDPTHFASWSGYPNGNDSDFPEYPIRVTHSDYQALSPCSQLQGGVQRQLLHSLQRVQVDVAYPPYRTGDHLKVVSLVGEPPHSTTGLTVLVNDSGVPSPMSAGATANLTARLQDGSGTVIQDALFNWGVEPDSGNGSITAAEDGLGATFKNQFLLPDGSPTTTPGTTCTVEAWARYMGRPVPGSSGDIHL